MFSKKTLWFLVTILLISFILPACSSSDANKTSDTSGTSHQAEQTKSQTEQKKEGESNAEPVILKFLHYQIEWADRIDNLSDEFNKDVPNVTIENEASSDFYTILRTRIASNDIPDILGLPTYYALKDYKEYLLDLTGEPYWDEVMDYAKLSVTVDGKLFGIPLDIETWGIIYDKDTFTKAGINELPRTLTQLRDTCEKIKKLGILPFGEGYKEDWIIGHIFRMIIGCDPTPAKTMEDVMAGKIKLKDLEACKKLFDFFDIVKENCPEKALEIDYAAQCSSLGLKKAAMITQGDWAEDMIKMVNPDINIGMMGVPISEDPSECRLYSDVSWCMAISKSSKHVDEAKELFSWIVSKPNGKKWLETVGEFSTRLRAIIRILECLLRTR
ncbi:MAG TPA: extracellular solute-binding protein [Clostridiaceae bacterium]|nr:extracellular solute-binding protein [Clostridiaceae bacterium]